jgi:tetratricopeptide (TPR) repeat protein
MPDIAETISAALDRHQAGARDEAEALYRQALDADPREPTALYLFGLFNFEAGRVEAADRLLSRVVEVRPGHAEGHVALANLAYWRGRHPAAVEGYKRALAIQPDHAAALINLAQALRDQGQFDCAITAGHNAAKRLLDPAPAYAALGGTYAAAGRAAEAIEAYRSAIALAPRDVSIRVGLGMALLDAGDAKAALACSEDTLTWAPDQAEAWFVKGSALTALRRYEAAVTAFEQAVALDPDHAATRLGLGNAYAELDHADRALEHLTRAAELDPGSKEIHASMGSVLYRCGEAEAAEKACWLALAADSSLVIPHQNLAAIHADRGEPDLARHHRDQAYRQKSLFVEAASDPEATVLIFTTSQSGNVPHKYLLPADRYTRLNWFIEYARDGEAAALPAYDVVFNIIGDPDAAGSAEAPVADFLKSCPRAVINDPAKVRRTRRDRLSDLLAGVENLLTPRAVRFDAETISAKGLAACIDASGLDYPLLVRPIGSHGGAGLILAQGPGDLGEVGLRAGVYVTEYVDGRGADGLYRKYRMIFVDGQAFPYHLAIADDWLVHYGTAGMEDEATRQLEERWFLRAPEAALGQAALTAIEAVGQRLGLDYAGVDFSVLPDGRAVVFEANATMLVHPEDPDGEFAYKNPEAARIFAAFQAMVAARSPKK